MSHVRELLARNRDELNVTQRRQVDAHLATCGECRGLQADLAQSDRLLSAGEPDLPIPPFDRQPRPPGPATPFVLAAFGALALIAILVLAPVLGAMVERVAGPTPTGSPAPSERASTSPTPSAPAGFATYESPILGYRMSLPAAYRRTGSSITGDSELLGRDSYTSLTEAEEREECLRDGGRIPSRAAAAYLYVEAYRNVAETSAVEWARSRSGNRSTVEPATIDGREAARVVELGATSLYVIRANDRIYVLTPTIMPTQHPLDDIAASFRAITPQPFPTPTAPSQTPPRDAARALGGTLASAFAARDTDGIARLITPRCSLAVWSVVEPVQPGGESCCVLNRAVAPFIQALRDRFTSGDLSVTVDPEVQVRIEGGRERFFVRSEWREPDRTIQIDLYLEEVDGQWRWVAAMHHYQRADLIRGICVPYGSPWVSGSC